MSGAHSRRKGARFELELVHTFREALGDDAIRRGFQCRAGTEAPDVDIAGWWVEAKHHKRVNVTAALAQAIAAAPPERIPVAVCKSDRQAAVVVLRLDDFLPLLAQHTHLARKVPS